MEDKFVTEYEQSFENWRFFVGLRFTVVAFFLTLTTALLGIAFTHSIFKIQLYQCLISGIGIFATWAIMMLEGRNRKLYFECIQRAIEIENQNMCPDDSSKGLAYKLHTSKPCKLSAWHTGGFSLLYRMTLFIWIVLFIAALCNAFPAAHAAQGDTVSVDVLAKSSFSWNGAKLPDYPDGEPEISILRIVIPAGYKLPLHEHPVINAGVLLKGELTVITADDKTLEMKAGDPIIEVVDTWHYGINNGETDAEIIVFYAGTKDTPITVKQDS